MSERISSVESVSLIPDAIHMIVINELNCGCHVSNGCNGFDRSFQVFEAMAAIVLTRAETKSKMFWGRTARNGCVGH